MAGNNRSNSIKVFIIWIKKLEVFIRKMNYKLKKSEVKGIIKNIKKLGIYPLLKPNSKKNYNQTVLPEITIIVDDKTPERLIVQIKDLL
jgi:hypothetical protein